MVLVPVVWLVDSLGCPWLFYCKVIFALYQWRVFLAVTGLSLKNVGCYIRDEQRIFPTGILKTIFFWMLEQLTSPDRHLTTRPILFCSWFTFEASRGHRLGHLWASSVEKKGICIHIPLLWTGNLNQPVVLQLTAEGLNWTLNTVPKGQPIMHWERTCCHFTGGISKEQERRLKHLIHPYILLTLRF